RAERGLVRHGRGAGRVQAAAAGPGAGVHRPARRPGRPPARRRTHRAHRPGIPDAAPGRPQPAGPARRGSGPLAPGGYRRQHGTTTVSPVRGPARPGSGTAPATRPGEEDDEEQTMAGRAGTRDRWLWTTGASVSFLGDGAFWLALGIWVKDLTGSNGRAALAMFCYLAPRMLSPLTGLVADRFRRRGVLLVAYPLMAAEVLAVLPVHGAGQVWLVYAVLAGLGLGSGLTAAAGSALLTLLVPGDELGRANAVLRTAKEIGLLVAPVAGAGLYALAGAHLVAILEAATFVLAAGCVAPLPLPA